MLKFEKIHGATERNDGLMKIGWKTEKHLVSYGLYTDDEDMSGDGTGASGGIMAASEDAEDDTQAKTGWQWQCLTMGKPALADIREAIHGLIDAQTDYNIENKCTWNGISVYLSEENQRNFKAVYDLSVQLNGQTLPQKFKLGEDADGKAQYYTFEDMDTFTSFYTTCVSHIQTCLEAGWTEKDSIDWSKYE